MSEISIAVYRRTPNTLEDLKCGSLTKACNLSFKFQWKTPGNKVARLEMSSAYSSNLAVPFYRATETPAGVEPTKNCNSSFPKPFLRLYCEIYCVRNWFIHPLTALLLRNTKAKGGTRPAEIEPIHKQTDMIIICHIWALENNPYTEIPTEINTCVRPTDTGAFFFCAWPAPVTCLLF